MWTQVRLRYQWPHLLLLEDESSEWEALGAKVVGENPNDSEQVGELIERYNQNYQILIGKQKN